MYQISGREQSATVCALVADLGRLYQISGREQSATPVMAGGWVRYCIRSAAGSNPQHRFNGLSLPPIVSDQRPGAIRNGRRLFGVIDLLYQISGREQSATATCTGITRTSLYQISGREQSATSCVLSDMDLYCIRSAAGSNPQRALQGAFFQTYCIRSAAGSNPQRRLESGV